MELVSIEDNRNNIVVKHKELVHNARYRLSELGIKVLSVLISMIKISDTEFTQYAIQIKDFKELIHSDSKNTYKYAHKLVTELMSNPMQIGDEQFNWVSYGKYAKGDGVIIFEIHRLLKPYLLELKNNFLQYNITNILPLKSGYVIRLYELCKDHYSEATRYKESTTFITFDIKIERLRELFEIPNSYAYKDIRVNVLDKAVEQFRKKTDIQIDYKEQKIGRKVDRLIITVRDNHKGSNDYLKNRRAYIAHVRKKYKPNPANNKYPTILSTQQGDVKIDFNGKIYLAKIDGGIEDYTKEQSEKLWNWLYELALKEK